MADRDALANRAVVLTDALGFVESVRAFRLRADAAEGSLPFNTVDYYAMDDLIAALREALREPPTAGSAEG